MNVNEKIMALKEVTGYDVSEDVYEGEEDKYITFTYEDERPEFRGDNHVIYDTAYIQVNFFCPTGFQYADVKHKIRDHLEKMGFKVTIRTWLEDRVKGTERIRRILFETTYTERRK